MIMNIMIKYYRATHKVLKLYRVLIMTMMYRVLI